MAKEPNKPLEPDALLAFACRKRGGEYEVFTVSRKGGEQVEEVLKRTPDRRIAADKISTALLGSSL